MTITNAMNMRLNIKFTVKRIRIVIGIMMLFSFISLILTIDFFVKVISNSGVFWLTAWGIVLATYWHFFVPALFAIALSYFLLTRIYKYEAEEKVRVG